MSILDVLVSTVVIAVTLLCVYWGAFVGSGRSVKDPNRFPGSLWVALRKSGPGLPVVLLVACAFAVLIIQRSWITGPVVGATVGWIVGWFTDLTWLEKLIGVKFWAD